MINPYDTAKDIRNSMLKHTYNGANIHESYMDAKFCAIEAVRLILNISLGAYQRKYWQNVMEELEKMDE